MTRITTSRRQGQAREGRSEGSPSANVRADGQKLHRRLSLRASQHLMTKPTGTADRVNAAVVHGEFMFLLGEICSGRRCKAVVKQPEGPAGVSRPRRQGGLSAMASESDNDTIAEHSAPGSNLRRYRTEVSRGRTSC